MSAACTRAARQPCWLCPWVVLRHVRSAAAVLTCHLLLSLCLHCAQAVAAQGPVVAVGTSLGACALVQLPSHHTLPPVLPPPTINLADILPGAQPPPSTSTTASSSQGSGGAPASVPGAAAGGVVVVGEPRGEAEGVVSLSFTHVVAASDPLWLVVGHASGTVVVWDIGKKPPRQMAAISE
jgi:hypothetical protein